MRIIVLGAGVIGVSSAYYLASQGHKVTVLEKNNEPGSGCSFANGSQLSYSHTKTWAEDLFFSKFVKTVLHPTSFASIKKFDKKTLNWLVKFTKNSSPKKALINSQNLYSIAVYSKDLMKVFLDKESQHNSSWSNGRNFNYKKNGILHFYRSKKAYERDILNIQYNLLSGNRPIVYSANQCIEHEANLVKLLDKKQLAGGILYPEDASADSYLFTKNLAKLCEEKYGVEFVYNVEVKNLLNNYQKITGINTQDKVYIADAYVYALGALSNKMLSGINVNTDVLPVKGYSLSINCNEEYIAPTSCLTDVEKRIVYSRIGNVFRVGGVAEFASTDIHKNSYSKPIKFLKNNLLSTFSNFGDIDSCKHWSGFRPLRPNSIPLICNSKKYPNLYLNTGHGSLGWTLSLASGKILSDLINNHTSPAFDFLNNELN
ncbi:D-amino acid dehydrogenase [Alphaproteobacteria bacterium]|nr:D-amino acid dehydrogenase [Alphaproteobacteria bacterium]